MLKRNVQMSITLALGIIFSIAGGFIPWFFIPATLFIIVFSWLIFFNAHATNAKDLEITKLYEQMDKMRAEIDGVKTLATGLSMMGGRR